MTEFPIDVEPEDEADTKIVSLGKQPSIVDLLRQDLKELEESEEVFIPIIGYERVGLQVKYRLPESGKELDAIARKVAREYKDQFSRALYTAIDTMITLCLGLYVSPSEELGAELETEVPREPVELDPDLSGEAVKFDERLAEALGFSQEVHSARAVVRRVFGGNDMAIMTHGERLNRWLANTKANLDVEFWQLGEER
jgi:hypothetical protein